MTWTKGQDHDGLLEGFAKSVGKKEPPRELTFPRQLDQTDRGLATNQDSTANDRNTQVADPATARDDRDRWPLAD